MDYVASRTFRHEGKTYPQGKPVKIDEGLAAEWQAVGLIEPAPPKPEPQRGKPKP